MLAWSDPDENFRTYTPDTGRYTSADVIGYGGGINHFRYAESNPLINVDALGLWSADAHNYIIERFYEKMKASGAKGFNGDINKRFIEQGSKITDRNQDKGSSFMHAMRSSADQTPYEACVKMVQFVKGKVESFYRKMKESEDSGNKQLVFDAFEELGQGLHAMMDYTSPQHEEYQVWNGSCPYRNGSQIWNHLTGEGVKEAKANGEARTKAAVTLMENAYNQNYVDCSNLNGAP